MNVDRTVKLLFAALSWLVLAACSGAPDCHYQGPADQAPSAGCLVLREGRLLLMEGRGGKFGPPGGSVEPGESAQCGAERETWEETGVAVRATSLATQFNNGFHLYWCQPVGDFNTHIQRPLEVASVGLFAPNDFYDLVWRFPDQAALIHRMVNQKLRERPYEQ